MNRLDVAVYGQLVGLVLVAVGCALAWLPLAVAVLGGGLVWWFRYVFQVEVDEQ